MQSPCSESASVTCQEKGFEVNLRCHARFLARGSLSEAFFLRPPPPTHTLLLASPKEVEELGWGQCVGLCPGHSAVEKFPSGVFSESHGISKFTLVQQKVHTGQNWVLPNSLKVFCPTSSQMDANGIQSVGKLTYCDSMQATVEMKQKGCQITCSKAQRDQGGFVRVTSFHAKYHQTPSWPGCHITDTAEICPTFWGHDLDLLRGEASSLSFADKVTCFF